MMDASFAAGYPVLVELDAVASSMRNVWSVTKEVTLDYLVKAVEIAHPGLDREMVKKYLGQSMKIQEYCFEENE